MIFRSCSCGPFFLKLNLREGEKFAKGHRSERASPALGPVCPPNGSAAWQELQLPAARPPRGCMPLGHSLNFSGPLCSSLSLHGASAPTRLGWTGLRVTHTSNQAASSLRSVGSRGFVLFTLALKQKYSQPQHPILIIYVLIVNLSGK